MRRLQDGEGNLNMMVKKPPQDTTDCDIVMLGVRRTTSKIDWPHIEKRNKEFRTSKKTKVKENLTNWLLDKKTIKDFIRQLDQKEPEEEGIDKVRKNIKYYGYQPVVDWRNGLKYRIIWLHDDYNSEIIGVITVYPFE